MNIPAPIDQTPPPDALELWAQVAYGRYVLAWEQACVNKTVADIFGYHALQIGAPSLNYLAASRISHRWIYAEQASAHTLARAPEAPEIVLGHYSDLPFPADSIDLVVLPHTLETCAEPHRLLREVDRILTPHGRVVILGFNTFSWWSWRAHWESSRSSTHHTCLPQGITRLSMLRVKDWLQLLGYQPRRSHLGAYRWPRQAALVRALSKYGEEKVHQSKIEAAGQRWWPMLGAVYLMEAVKEVKSMRLVGLINARRKLGFRAVVSATKKAQERRSDDS